MKHKKFVALTLALGYGLFVAASCFWNYEPGQQIGANFAEFTMSMVKILPAAFVLIGLFEVWIDRAMIETHLGKDSGPIAYLWSILLAGTTVGGLYVAFPFAHTLYSKGAKLSIIFSYLGCAAICRVPMTIFEASFLGLKFTAVRLAVSLPLVIGTSILLGRLLEQQGYTIRDAGVPPAAAS